MYHRASSDRPVVSRGQSTTVASRIRNMPTNIKDSARESELCKGSGSARKSAATGATGGDFVCEMGDSSHAECDIRAATAPTQRLEDDFEACGSSGGGEGGLCRTPAPERQSPRQEFIYVTPPRSVGGDYVAPAGGTSDNGVGQADEGVCGGSQQEQSDSIPSPRISFPLLKDVLPVSLRAISYLEDESLAEVPLDEAYERVAVMHSQKRLKIEHLRDSVALDMKGWYEDLNVDGSSAVDSLERINRRVQAATQAAKAEHAEQIALRSARDMLLMAMNDSILESKTASSDSSLILCGGCCYYRSPYALPCGHVFCLDCIRASKYNTCATCDAPFEPSKALKIFLPY